MAAYVFTPVAVAGGATVRFDTASGSDSPATVYPLDYAQPIPGALVRAHTTTGNLPRIESDSATLYQKTLDYRGVTVTATTALTGVVQATGADVGAAGLAANPAFTGTFATIAAARLAASPLLGLPCADNTYATPPVGTTRTAVGTGRVPHTVSWAATDLRLVYVGWANNSNTASPNYNDVEGPGSVTFGAAIEIGGTIFRVTFGGKAQTTLDAAGYVISDPLPLDVAAGDIVYSRTFVASGSYYTVKYTGPFGTTGGGGWTVTTDLTAPGSAAIADSTGNPLFAPAAVVGKPTGTASKTCLVVGDSIASGFGDYNVVTTGRLLGNPAVTGGGFVNRAFYRDGIGLLKVSTPGDAVSNFVGNAGHSRRLAFAEAAGTMLCDYGRNDITNGRTLSQVQGDLLTAWGFGSKRGLRVFQTTITPRTTSTDGWLTSGNQTSTGNESVRVAMNAWLRAGAPISAGAAVAVGTTGATLAGQSGHPLYGVLEVTDLVETARDSGIWKAALNARTVTDGAATSASTTITSATAAFTTGDVGRQIVLVGAGSAGAVYAGTITVRNSATSVGVDTTIGTTVSAASLTVADSYSLDGLHPSGYGHTQMAAGVVTSSFL
jgi:hypothetical protein